jgi:hypothetical protein
MTNTIQAAVIIYIAYRLVETTVSAMQRNWKSGIVVLVSAILAGYCIFYVGRAESEHEAFVAKAINDAALTAKQRIDAEHAYQKCLHPDGLGQIGLGKEYCDKLKDDPEQLIKSMRMLHYIE